MAAEAWGDWSHCICRLEAENSECQHSVFNALQDQSLWNGPTHSLASSYLNLIWRVPCGFSWCLVSQEILNLNKLIPLLTTALGVAPAVTLVTCGLNLGFWLLLICALQPSALILNFC